MGNRPSRDRPARNPSGMVCERCSESFIGEEWHVFCAACVQDVANEIAAVQTHARDNMMYARWGVDFVIEPTGREFSVEIDAPDSRLAMFWALADLRLAPNEMLHSLYAHIGRPQTSE